ncbi:MAG TPA: flagellar motor protein MotB [Bacillota bacterium]|nr:flagellar motor protein MotB [Bacillota bacterium]
MSGRKKHYEERADETWLLPYSDLLTLLLALFIVMFAMGNLDKEKFKQISEKFNVIFAGGNGFVGNGQTGAPIQLPGGGGKSVTPNKHTVEERKMLEMKEGIEEEIYNSGYSDKIKVNLTREGLEISIQEVVLFNSGEARILENVTHLLLQIAKILNGLDNQIVIAGHTDNVPIRTREFSSNWVLSAMRAINVMEFLTAQGGLEPERFSIQGYSQYSPKYDNATEDGRAKNRRVEIFLIRKYPLTPKNAEILSHHEKTPQEVREGSVRSLKSEG